MPTIPQRVASAFAVLCGRYGDVSEMAPRMNYYERMTDPVGTPAVRETAKEDLYLSLMAFSEDRGTASFNAWIFPLVGWIWYSIPVLVLGSQWLVDGAVSIAQLVSRRPFAGYWEYLLDEAIYTAPATVNWQGAALLSRDGKLLGIGSLVVGDALGLAAMERVFEILATPPDKPDPPGAVDAPRRVHEIRFDTVGFAYREGHPAVRDFSLNVPGGPRYATRIRGSLPRQSERTRPGTSATVSCSGLRTSMNPPVGPRMPLTIPALASAIIPRSRSA